MKYSGRRPWRASYRSRNSLTRHVAFIVLVEPDPACELFAPPSAGRGELECRRGVPRRHPTDLPQRIVHPENAEPETDVHDGVGLVGRQRLHRSLLLGLHLGDGDLPGDAQARRRHTPPWWFAGTRGRSASARTRCRRCGSRRVPATVAMMIGSSSIDPVGSPKTHSPSMVSVRRHRDARRPQRAPRRTGRNGCPVLGHPRPEDDEANPRSTSSKNASRTARNDPLGRPCTARTTNSTGRSRMPCFEVLVGDQLQRKQDVLVEPASSSM